jgi:hypothetical protein
MPPDDSERGPSLPLQTIVDLLGTPLRLLDLPRGVMRVLDRGHIRTLADLLRLNDDALRALPGMRASRFHSLTKRLRDAGLRD